jgi:hypothetical protein
MALFVVKHEHSAETCPAGHPEMGPMLAQHVTEQNAQQFGLSLHGEAVVDGAHTLFLIVDGDREQIDRFMAPFTQVGTVDVMQSSRCEQVVARARC